MVPVHVDNFREIASKRGLPGPRMASPWTRPVTEAAHIVTAVTGCLCCRLTEAGRRHALEALWMSAGLRSRRVHIRVVLRALCRQAGSGSGVGEFGNVAQG